MTQSPHRAWLGGADPPTQTWWVLDIHAQESLFVESALRQKTHAGGSERNWPTLEDVWRFLSANIHNRPFPPPPGPEWQWGSPDHHPSPLSYLLQLLENLQGHQWPTYPGSPSTGLQGGLLINELNLLNMEDQRVPLGAICVWEKSEHSHNIKDLSQVVFHTKRHKDFTVLVFTHRH